jgi:hypothetical protein
MSRYLTLWHDAPVVDIPPHIPTTIHERAEALEAKIRYTKAKMVREGWVLVHEIGRWPRTRRNATA